MKKVVRILGFCALVAFAFTACKKNNDTNGKVAIKVSMPTTYSDGKTYLDGNKVKWSDGDQITVFDPAITEGDKFVQLTLARGTGQTDAVFYGDSSFFSKLDTDSVYTAFYPVDSISGITEDKVVIAIPNNQTFVENSFSPNTYPMYAKNDHNSHFQFKSPAGLLTIPVTIPDTATIDSIKITSVEVMVSSGNPLSGNLKYNQALTDGDSNGIADYVVETHKYKVFLNFGADGFTLTKGQTVDFNIVLLEGSLNASKFSVEILGEDDVVWAGLNGSGNNPVLRQTRIQMPVISLPLPPTKTEIDLSE